MTSFTFARKSDLAGFFLFSSFFPRSAAQPWIHLLITRKLLQLHTLSTSLVAHYPRHQLTCNSLDFCWNLDCRSSKKPCDFLVGERASLSPSSPPSVGSMETVAPPWNSDAAFAILASSVSWISLKVTESKERVLDDWKSNTCELSRPF